MILFFYSCKGNNDMGLSVKDEYYYLDKIEIGDTIDLNVLLENQSSDIIHIDTILVSCECVEILTDFKCLKPMSQDTLKVRFLPLQPGFISRGFSIRYNRTVKDVIIEGYVESL